MEDAEAIWVQQARTGDQAALTHLVEAYQTPIYNLAYRMLGNATEAEDAAQETFIRAYRRLDTYDPTRKFSSWLLAIASHYCVDVLRRRRMNLLSFDELPPMVELSMPRTTQPEQVVISQQQADAVQDLLEILPPAYRTPVILLLDAMLGHMRERIELPDQETLQVWDRELTRVPPEWYKAYENEPRDVPPLAPFGDGYRYHITGLFHDEHGYPTQRLDEVNAWQERIFGKIERGLGEIADVEMGADLDQAEVVVLSYGAAARSAQRAIRLARERGFSVSLLKLRTLWPFPEREVERVAEHIQCLIVPELNRGQLALEVERVVGRAKVVRINRAAPEDPATSFRPEDID